MPFLMSASCDDPGTITQARKIGNDYSHGQIVTYECITQGYSLIGNPTLTCNDGRWDSQRPQCKGICFVLFLMICELEIMLSSDRVHSKDLGTINWPCLSKSSRRCP